MQTVTKLFLMPGELVIDASHIEGEDQRTTIRMLVNSLFWGILIIALVFIFS